MVGGNLFISLAILVTSGAVLLYAVLAFAHVRITDADMADLEQLRAQGLLPAEPHLIEDFQLVHRRLVEIAPAVCLRQEAWLQLYFHLLRVTRWLRPVLGSHAWLMERLDLEMLRLSAYQARHYRAATTRLDAIRNPGL